MGYVLYLTTSVSETLQGHGSTSVTRVVFTVTKMLKD